MKQTDEPRAPRAVPPWLAAMSGAEALAELAELTEHTAVFAVDRERTVVFWSRGAEELLGFAQDEVVGNHCLKASRCTTCMRGCGIGTFGQVRNVSLTMHRSDGVAVRVRKNARGFFDADGEFAGGLEVLVPERDAAEAELEATREGAVFHGLVTREPAMEQIFRTVRSVAETDVSVLVGGESGTGKELVARALHAESPRRDRPFVAVNCAALVPTLLESELFGHVKGSFTGAVRDRVGLLSQADGGTLFLDEVAELPLDLQAKLLRVVEERTFVRVGDTETVSADVRIVAATHRSLPSEVKAGRFREDLMYRLRVVPLILPPLRRRRGDIEALVWHFIDRRNRDALRRIDTISPEATRVLLSYRWPGNVRELQNAIAYAFAVGRGAELRLEDLPDEVRGDTEETAHSVPDLRPASDEATRIRAALAAAEGHLGKAAKLLGISRPTLWRKRRQYGID